MRLYELTSQKQPLYACRPVLNAEAILAWAKQQGFASTLPPHELHVTVAYSRAPVVWDSIGADTNSIAIRGGAREVKPLGDRGTVVLSIEDDRLTRRWQRFINAGCSWDYADYLPHISLTYDGRNVNLDGIEPYTGPILLGPEIFAELDEDWGKKVEEDRLDEMYRSMGGF